MITPEQIASEMRGEGLSTMRSEQVENLASIPAEEKLLYTDLQILESGAGWYIGTLYNNPEGFVEPGSRDSEYFPTRKAAEDAWLSGMWTQRMTP